MEHYEKGEKLGQGQFGVVIKARHIGVRSACRLQLLLASAASPSISQHPEG